MNITQKIIDQLINDYLDIEDLIDDGQFDQIYSGHFNEISDIHWTPVKVAVKAANLLVSSSESKVMDIGSGVGKFCLIGALTTSGHFTGVEYRKSLVKFSRLIIKEFKLSNIEIVHSDIANIDFSEFDAFYFFNAFYENTFHEDTEKHLRIDSSVELSMERYQEYTKMLFKKLENLNKGTKIATYCGNKAQIPDSYRLAYADLDCDLKLWIKD